MFFDQYTEFVENDVRSQRGTTPVTSESLTKRCQALLPAWLVMDKTILDLGHCLGAFGHWSLANGAKHYTGVDIQKSFCDKSEQLLSKYWDINEFTIEQDEVQEFLYKTPHKKYDIVIVSGIIHCYVNPITFMEAVCNAANEVVVIETQEADESTGIPAIQFKIFNMVSDNIGKPYSGWSSAVGFNAMRAIMGENKFELYGERIYPQKIEGSHDAYNDEIEINTSNVYAAPKRYMVRYRRTRREVKTSLQYNVLHNVQKHNPAYVSAAHSKIIKTEKWEFDDSVASRFQEEARSNIPDYDRVIEMCVDLAKRKLGSDDLIVDVGSALGHTVDVFKQIGYTNVIGVESSQAMINNSLHKESIVLCDTFPDVHPKFVMANWTLHFVDERRKYIEDVYASMESGTFILTDKTPQSDEVKEMYYDFKRSHGISDTYIYEKEHKLKGYMTLLPIQWYLDTLTSVGFTNVQIINSKYGFVTFYCEKKYG